MLAIYKLVYRIFFQNFFSEFFFIYKNLHIEPFNTVHKNGLFLFLCTSRLLKLGDFALVTQPMQQLRPNPTELRLMDYYHQIFCRFWKCKRKVPQPTFFKIITEERRWRNFSLTFSESTKNLILTPSDSVAVAT